MERMIYANAFWNLLQQVVYDIFTVHEHDGKLTGTASVGYYSETIEKVLKQTPTVDAVEVVRCKDCKRCFKHTTKRNRQKMLICMRNDMDVCVRPDDFCSYGERRTDG